MTGTSQLSSLVLETRASASHGGMLSRLLIAMYEWWLLILLWKPLLPVTVEAQASNLSMVDSRCRMQCVGSTVQ